MLKALLVPLFFALAAMAMAQNLVPNPSFEDTTRCDISDPPFSEALHWTSPNLATPDLFDANLERLCGYSMGPDDSYYLPPADGLRVAAGFQWYGPNSSNTREYLMAKLLQPLVEDQSYLVSLKCARSSMNHRAKDRIGVYFGMDSIFQNDGNTLLVVPQVELFDPQGGYLESTSWIQMTDTFVGAGGEQWIIYGTFQDANEVNGILLPPGWVNTAYYFFDEVSVEGIGHTGSEELPPHFIRSERWPRLLDRGSSAGRFPDL
ncbi:MAG: hypothetical protein M3R08_09950 [Bacteroidota bacterium]|nr:hypothetical protein [Bacteroidota bacterium]